MQRGHHAEERLRPGATAGRKHRLVGAGSPRAGLQDLLHARDDPTSVMRLSQRLTAMPRVQQLLGIGGLRRQHDAGRLRRRASTAARAGRRRRAGGRGGRRRGRARRRRRARAAGQRHARGGDRRGRRDRPPHGRTSRRAMRRSQCLPTGLDLRSGRGGLHRSGRQGRRLPLHHLGRVPPRSRLFSGGPLRARGGGGGGQPLCDL